MKQTFAIIAAVTGLAFALSTGGAFAKDKEVTVKGEAKCAKCALHETSACQTVIQAEKNGKKVNYYVTKNDVSKSFHQNVCTGSKEVVAKGTVAKVDGKNEITLSDIKLAAAK
jgi:hypothetical protein